MYVCYIYARLDEKRNFNFVHLTGLSNASKDIIKYPINFLMSTAVIGMSAL